MMISIKRFVTIGFIFLWLVQSPLLVFSAPTAFSGSFKVENEYTIAWSGDSEQIHFTIQAKTTGWVAFGIDPSVMMKDADIMIAYYDDTLKKGVIQDCYSVDETGPHPQDITLGGQDNISDFSISENNGYTMVQFSRPLQTNDPYDAVINPESNVKIMWAMGEEDNTDLIHAKKGFATIHWSKNSASTGKPTGKRGLPAHFILMSIGLLLIAFGVWLVKKNYPYAKKLKLHALTVTLGSFLLFFGFLLQFLWLQINGRGHFKVFHTWVGATSLLTLLACFTMAGLYMAKKTMNKRYWHISLGMAAAVLALVALILGKFLILNLY